MRFQNGFFMSSHTPKTVILGLYNEATDNYNLPSHYLLIFKCIYVSRENAY